MSQRQRSCGIGFAAGLSVLAGTALAQDAARLDYAALTPEASFDTPAKPTASAAMLQGESAAPKYGAEGSRWWTIGTGVAKGLGAGYDSELDLLVVNPKGGQNAMSVTVRGVMESGIKEYDDRSLKMPLETAQALLETDEVSRIIILLNDTAQTDAALKRVQAIIAEHGLALEVRPWSELAVYYHQVVSLFDGIFFFIKSIVSVIVVFMIGNTLMMNVVERTREIATLRALGLTQREAGRLFILEGIFIGLLGAALSVAVGIGLAELINIHGLPMPPSPGYTKGYLAFILWDEDVDLFWFTCALAIVTAVLASIIPAKRASKLLIAEAFRFT